MIASHYAEPLLRRIVIDAVARLAPAHDSEEVARVAAGEPYLMLDCSRGWAWGYLADGRVAYLEAAAVSA